MGAASFSTSVTVPKATTDQEAFQTARERAEDDHGRAGYTGTLAEKGSFVLIQRAPNKAVAEQIVSSLMDGGHDEDQVYRSEVTDLVDDKWGPAAAVRYPIDAKQDCVIFFGWASS